jgi:hypothetical protein
VGDLPEHLQNLVDVLSGVKWLVENRKGDDANRGGYVRLASRKPGGGWRRLAVGCGGDKRRGPSLSLRCLL